MIGDNEGLAELIDDNFDTDTITAMMNSDFSQGLLLGFIFAKDLFENGDLDDDETLN